MGGDWEKRNLRTSGSDIKFIFHNITGQELFMNTF